MNNSALNQLLSALGGLIIAISFLSCSKESIPSGQILLKNDIQDSTNNVIVIDQIIASGGRTGLRYTLKPGEKKLIPKKEIRALRFTRKYNKFSRVYLVKCPTPLKEGIAIKLIDVHTGRLKGNCFLAKKGEKKMGVIYWE